MKSKSILIFLFCLASLRVAAQTATIGPVASWVKKVGFDDSARPDAKQQSSVYYLLVDRQTNIRRQETYEHQVYKVINSEGVQSYSDLNFEFDPAYSKLILHELNIYRDGKVVRKLPTTLSTVRRETSMERYLYDGSLTCLINIPDIRVGDILEFSYTIMGFNPIYSGHYGIQHYFEYNVPVEKSSVRIIAPSEKKLFFKEVAKPPAVVITKIGAETEYTWTAPPAAATAKDVNEPGWYEDENSIQVSDLSTWKDVAAWALPMYTLTDSDEKELRQVVDTSLISRDPLQIIRFVQDEIRYLSVSIGIHSHKPHKSSQVYQQRFGDCKDKSMLLCALLRLKHIEAYPVLISTSWRSALDNRQPQINAFNHCVVQINLDGSIFYVDPTISNQGGMIGKIAFPSYGRGLVISKATLDLTTVGEKQFGETNEYVDYTLDKVDGDAKLDIRTIFHGSDADDVRAHFASHSRKDIEEQYIRFYGNLHPTITVTDSMTITDDRNSNEFSVNEHYKIPHAWKLNMGEGKDSVVQFEVYSLSMESYFNVSKSENRTAPYALPYPVHRSSTTVVYLPSEWTVKPERLQIVQKDYFYTYSRTAGMKAGQHTFNLEVQYQTLSDHVPHEKFRQFVKDHETMNGNLSFLLTFNKTVNAGEKSTTWVAVLFLMLWCILLLWLVRYLLTRYDPKPSIDEFEIENAEPIGGWLILLTIGFTLNPFLFLYGIVTGDSMETWLKWPAFLGAWKTLVAVILIAEQLYNFTMLAFSVLVLTTLYTRRTSFPSLAITFVIVNLIGQVADLFAAKSLGVEPTTAVTRSIIRAGVSAAIWIPYLLFSSRVKETFVFRYGGASSGAGTVDEPKNPSESTASR